MALSGWKGRFGAALRLPAWLLAAGCGRLVARRPRAGWIGIRGVYVRHADDAAKPQGRHLRGAPQDQCADRCDCRAGKRGDLVDRRLRASPRAALGRRFDPDQGLSGCPYGCRGSLPMGAIVPLRLWQAPAFVGLGGGGVVPPLSGDGLRGLFAGERHAGRGAHRQLADREPCGGWAARAAGCCVAGDLSDLQRQGLQIQHRHSSARHALSCRARLPACVFKTDASQRRLARYRRSLGDDDEILGVSRHWRGGACPPCCIRCAGSSCAQPRRGRRWSCSLRACCRM